jgi:lipoprotein
MLIMRKFSYLLMVMFSLFLFSCREEEEGTDTNGNPNPSVPVQPLQPERIVGEWNLIELTYSGELRLHRGGVVKNWISPTPLTMCEVRTKVNLLPGGTGTAEEWADTGKKCIMVSNGSITYTFDKDTRVLVIRMGAKTYRYVINNLTDNKMEREEWVSNADIGSGIFTGKIYTVMQKDLGKL